MSENIERTLGRLEEQSNTNSKDIRNIKESVERLEAFRWKILGMLTVGSALTSAVISLTIEMLVFRH